MQKHHEKLDKEKVGFMNFLTLLLGFSYAIMSYVTSSYFKDVAGRDDVSFFYLIVYLVIFLILLNLHKIVSRLEKNFVFYFSILIYAIWAVALYLLPLSWLGAAFLVLNLVFFNITMVEKDILLESYSTDRKSGRIRGLNLTLFHAGLIVGPLISTQILVKFGFQGVFLVQFFIISFLIFMAFFGLQKISFQPPKEISIKELFRKAVKRKNILRIYYVSCALESFFFVMLVYVPIHLRNLGVGWDSIGVILTIMLVPFILFEYPAGFLADKKLGEKELLIVALLIISFSCGALFFIKSTSILVWGGALFITRIGASLQEVLRESYFYKRIDAYDIDLIDFFKTSRPIGFIFMAIMTGVLLLFLPVEYVFILQGLISLSALVPAIFLVDNKSEREIAQK